MISRAEWDAIMEDYRANPVGFFRRQGGVRVGKRWRFPHAWIWWNHNTDYWHVTGRNGWKFQWGAMLLADVEVPYYEAAPAHALRIMLDCGKKGCAR